MTTHDFLPNKAPCHACAESAPGGAAEAANRALAACVLLPPGAVTARAEAGGLTLHGEVVWDYQRDAAERALSALPGMPGITNHIRVACRVAADAVRSGIRTALDKRAARETAQVQVVIDGGKVILRGTAASPAERDAILGSVWSMPGVMAVINEISVQP